jgi:hypothetical protein
MFEVFHLPNMEAELKETIRSAREAFNLFTPLINLITQEHEKKPKEK